MGVSPLQGRLGLKLEVYVLEIYARTKTPTVSLTTAQTASLPWWMFLSTGAPEKIRTPDPRNRSPVLYPAELRARWNGKKWGE